MHEACPKNNRVVQYPHVPHHRHTLLPTLQPAGGIRSRGYPPTAGSRPAGLPTRLARAYDVLDLDGRPDRDQDAHGVPQHVRVVELDRRARRRRARPGTGGAARIGGGDRRRRRAHRAVRAGEHLLARGAHRGRARETRALRQLACTPQRDVSGRRVARRPAARQARREQRRALDGPRRGAGRIDGTVDARPDLPQARRQAGRGRPRNETLPRPFASSQSSRGR